ncbi:putative metalloprotease CJM1_0395 family protein [Alteromonas flava]|uniref:putative metalloprotease CJM1_0395 family protein n=1 Tax=Alteromonas flava TaxID=2048003 RepID=UPI000C293FA2|nr:putative metalloprotease CJM1_0395 family protein [Alteromonas flava]
MNIVTPIPTGIVFTNTNLNTESARRENLARETIPQTGANENSEAKSGLGSESDRLKNPGQQPAPLVYERPQPNPNASPQAFAGEGAFDNANDQSAGKENAEERQREEQEQRDEREIQRLKQRDSEVRSHEQAHASVGGQYAGAPSYEYETGPDGKRYAVGGEVSIDVGEESSPEETLRKMQQVKAAALAPAEPSPQDLRVASEATQKAFEARSDIAQERAEELARAANPTEQKANPAQPEVPSLDEIVDGIDISIPERTLDNNGFGASAAVDRESLSTSQQRETLKQDEQTLKRVDVIQSRYLSIVTPNETGFSAVA